MDHMVVWYQMPISENHVHKRWIITITVGSCYSCSLLTYCYKLTKQKSSSSTWVMLATEWHLSCHDVMQCFVMSMTGDISLHMNLSILTLLLTLLDWLLARKPWIWEVLKFSSYSVRCIAFLVAKQKCKRRQNL